MKGTLLAEWQRLGYDRASQVADPLFVDLNGEYFRHQPGSPALEMGIQALDLKRVGVRPGNSVCPD